MRLVDGFTSTGCVVLSRTTVRGRLDLGDGRFHCPHPATYNTEGAAIRAVSSVFLGGMDLGWAAITPAINVTDATTTVLQDDPSNWPKDIYIAGFSYERFDAPRGGVARRRIWDWQRRLAWLRQQPEFDAGPYEQAARVFRQHGYAHGAEQLLIRQRSDARQAEGRTRSRVTSMIDWVFDWTVGYGYRPSRVLWLLATLLALVAATLATGVQRRRCGPATRASSSPPTDRSMWIVRPPASTLRRRPGPLLQPAAVRGGHRHTLIALDQRATWYPDRFVAGGQVVEWWLNLATMAGWLLSSISPALLRPAPPQRQPDRVGGSLQRCHDRTVADGSEDSPDDGCRPPAPDRHQQRGLSCARPTTIRHRRGDVPASLSRWRFWSSSPE